MSSEVKLLIRAKLSTLSFVRVRRMYGVKSCACLEQCKKYHLSPYPVG